MVSVLLGLWALVPFLDRRASREEPSPAFSDIGAAAILFLAFLTLQAWDIGGGGSATRLPDPAATARACALWTLGFAAVVDARPQSNAFT